MAAIRSMATLRRVRGVFTLVACLALVSQFALEDESAFAAPQVSIRSAGMETMQGKSFVEGAPYSSRPGGESNTARAAAAAAGLTIGQKVINAMGAGAVAAVIQAAMSAVCEPIVNRVLVKRMKIADAMAEVTPAMMVNYFKTTISTNLLKFPLFEAINAFCGALPISPSLRGLITGFVFTTATLPVTNFRYRKSMQLPVNWGNIYEAYFPTVIRDIVYANIRSWATVSLLSVNPSWTMASPSLLFCVVIAGCLGSAPFNEWRGFLLQSKGKSLTFSEFFKPANFIRSTSLGAMQQAIALAVGYWCAPPATKLVHSLFALVKH